MTDMVNRPPHYTNHPSGVECIEIAEHFSFNLGNVLKYLWRAGLKTDVIEDLSKAEWYLKREIARLRKIEKGDTSAERKARKIAQDIIADVGKYKKATRKEIAAKLKAKVTDAAPSPRVELVPEPAAEPAAEPAPGPAPEPDPQPAAPDAAETAADTAPYSLGGEDVAAPAPDERTASGATPPPAADPVVADPPPADAGTVLRVVADTAPASATRRDIARYLDGLPKDPFWTADRDAELVRILARGLGVARASVALKCDSLQARERWQLLSAPIRAERTGHVTIDGQTALIAVLIERAGW